MTLQPNLSKILKKKRKKEKNLAFEIVAMPFRFVMKLLISVMCEFCVARIAR